MRIVLNFLPLFCTVLTKPLYTKYMFPLYSARSTGSIYMNDAEMQTIHKARFVEIDGTRFVINCCEECPFFNDGAGYEYAHFCQNPFGTGDIRMELKQSETHKRCDRECPLREMEE